MSDPYVRHDSQVLVGVESDQGTSVAPTRTFGKLNGETEMPDPSVDWLEERSISANGGRELTGKYAGQNSYEGGSLPVNPVDGFPLAFAFGNEQYNDADDEHVIDVLNAKKPPTATVEATYFGRGGGDDFVRTFAGITPTSVTLTTDNESRLSTEMETIAMGVSPGTSPTTGITADTRDPFLFDDVSSNLSIAGTTYARVTEFEHELTTNASPEYYIAQESGRDPFEVLYANAEHELTATVKPTDDSLYQSLLGADDAGEATITFEKPNGDSIEYVASNVGLEEVPYSFPEEGAAEVSVTLIPNSVTITVVDTQSTGAYLSAAP